MDIFANINRSQLIDMILNPWGYIGVEGRGTGKSKGIGYKMDKIIRLMPRSVSSVSGATYGQILTKTLPSALKTLNELGYENGVNYVVNRKPPDHFLRSYEELNKFDNIISFSNGTCFALISLAEKGSGRGGNYDFEFLDEAATVDYEQYFNEIRPANRGNKEHFGNINFHHGFHYVTSMPQTDKGKYILEFAEYYKTEKGIDILAIWNKIVMLQLELLDITVPAHFVECWNEIERQRKKIIPFVSKEGILFTIGNGFDNIQALGISYFKKFKSTTPYISFMVEFMNYLFDKIESCFYSINMNRHVYYNGLNDKYIKDVAIQSDYNLDVLTAETSDYDFDCNPSSPLEIVPDWGAKISLFCVCQERNYDFVNKVVTKIPVHNFINEFFVKPDEGSNVMIIELVNRFSLYYKNHKNRELIYYKDRYGDSKNPNVFNQETYNELAIKQLTKNGWKVKTKVHKGNEPPNSDKYMLWGKLLSEKIEDLPLIRFNGMKCKYTLISMNNTEVKDIDGHLKKDKSSERKSNVPQEEATHFSDAADKIIWTKYSEHAVKYEYEDYTRVC